MNKRIIFLASVILLLLGIVIAVTVKLQAAKENTGLTVHPSNFTVLLNQPYTNTITVDNHMDQTIPIQVLLRNFTAQGEQGGIDLTAQDTTYALAKWIKVTPNETTIPAHSSHTFTFTITPPAHAEPGGHFGSIVFATIPSKNTQGSGAVLSEEIASLILATVPGNAKEEAHVASFTTDKPFYEFGPVNFLLRVENTGAVHIQPFGAIQVTNMWGQTTDLPVDPTNILPDSIRRISATLNRKLLIGKYTARIIASYGDKNLPLTGEVVFYAFPVRYAVVVIIISILLFLMRKRLGKSIKMLVTGK